MKKIIFILISSVTVFAGCQYEYEPYFATPEPAVQLEDLTAYSYFKTGTYWIYKDSASGVEDSVYVFYDTTFQYHLGPGNIQAEGDYMYYSYRANSSIDSFSYYYDIDYGFYSPGTNTVGVSRKKVKPGNYIGTSLLMVNYFKRNYPFGIYSSPGDLFFKTFHDSLQLNNTTYFSVASFEDTKNASESYMSSFGLINPKTEYSISKNIGVIKIKIIDNQFNTINKIKYLVRYHIVQ